MYKRQIHERPGLSKRSKSQGKLAKPPVIALAALNHSSATNADELRALRQVGMTDSEIASSSSQAPSTARIVMTDSAAAPMARAATVPVAEAPAELTEQLLGSGNSEQNLRSGSSSRRAFETFNPIEPFPVQQAHYEEPIEGAVRR